MQSKAATVEAYLKELPSERQVAMKELRKTILENLPDGFKEGMGYGMIGFVVPHSLYSNGYHCNPEHPLPFMNIASQKNFIALYHMGIYGDKKLLEWFTEKYARADLGKLDMGKSCIRFKNLDKIPYSLIGELCKKMTVKQWIELYETTFKNTGKKSL